MIRFLLRLRCREGEGVLSSYRAILSELLHEHRLPGLGQTWDLNDGVPSWPWFSSFVLLDYGLRFLWVREHLTFRVHSFKCSLWHHCEIGEGGNAILMTWKICPALPPCPACDVINGAPGRTSQDPESSGRIFAVWLRETTNFHKWKWACLLMGPWLPIAFNHVYNQQGEWLYCMI